MLILRNTTIINTINWGYFSFNELSTKKQERDQPEYNGKVGCSHLVVPASLGNGLEVTEQEGQGGRVTGRKQEKSKLKVF